MQSRRKVCIVTPGYIASTPRVVREADALAKAGLDVRVVFTQGQLEHVREFDAELVKGRAWRHASFKWSSSVAEERWAHLRSGLRQRIALAMPASTWSVAGVAERAEGRVYPELGDLAAAETADLYIGHYPTGLAAACRAARRHHVLVGYDVEDLYSETFPEGAEWALPRARIMRLEKRYVPRCAYVSAVSKPVAEAFAKHYASPMPVVVHNCHSWREREALQVSGPSDRRGPALSLYWYSQVIGLDRGIQDAIRASGQLSSPPQIHLRGDVDDRVRAELMGIAASSGVAGAIHFHPPCDPSELLARAVEHDVGLALEGDVALNRRLAVTNKIFLYLTAGLAVAATDLPGQRAVMEHCADAGALYEPGDVRSLAAILQRWQSDPDLLSRTKRAALNAARTRWNMEREEQVIVEKVRSLLSAQTVQSGQPALASSR